MTPRPKAVLTADRAFGVLALLVLLALGFHLHELGIVHLLLLEQSAAQRSAHAAFRPTLPNGSLTRAVPCSAATTCAACISTPVARCAWDAGSGSMSSARCVSGDPTVMRCDAPANGAPANRRAASTARKLADRLARAAVGIRLPEQHVNALRGKADVVGGVGAAAGASARPPAIEVGASHSRCAHRRPYHVILTAAAGVYQEWQTRIAYYHYTQLKAREPCSDLGGFTRLLSTPDGKPDWLAGEIPTIVTKQLSHGSCDTCDHGFVVMNRPWSLKQLAASNEWVSIVDEYLFIMETDHLLLRAFENTATSTAPVGFGFYYMTYKYDREKLGPVVKRWHDPDAVDPVGPSPLIIHKAQLESLIDPYWSLCLELKRDPAADKAFGWVLEMWAWALAAARAGVRHQVHTTFQAEPGGVGISDLERYDIYHYTFDLEVPNTNWRWSKRVYMGNYATKVDAPPRGARGSTHTFVSMLNSAIDSFGPERWRSDRWESALVRRAASGNDR